MIVGQAGEQPQGEGKSNRYVRVWHTRFVAVPEIVGQPRRYLTPLVHDQGSGQETWWAKRD